MAWTVGRLLAILAALALLPSALAHSPGEGPLEATGFLPLDPGNSYELELTSLGDVEGGDLLTLRWSVNDGAGPPVRFALWAGEGAARERVYEVEAASDDVEMTFPDAATYQVAWTNDASVSVTLAYHLSIAAPQGSAFEVIPLILLAAAGVLFVYLLWRGRRRRGEPTETGTE